MSSQLSPITDELLSLYIDDAVTDHERSLVEAALASDADLAWRLDTLRHTVRLLRQLPELPLPRSFVLQEAQVSDVVAARRAIGTRRAATMENGGWVTRWQSAWRAFWRAGNPVLRNAAAAAFVLLLVVAGSRTLIQPAMAPLTASAPAEMAAPVAVEAPAAAENDLAAVSQESTDADASTAYPELAQAQAAVPEIAALETSDVQGESTAIEEPPVDEIEALTAQSAAPASAAEAAPALEAESGVAVLEVAPSADEEARASAFVPPSAGTEIGQGGAAAASLEGAVGGLEDVQPGAPALAAAAAPAEAPVAKALGESAEGVEAADTTGPQVESFAATATEPEPAVVPTATALPTEPPPTQAATAIAMADQAAPVVEAPAATVADEPIAPASSGLDWSTYAAAGLALLTLVFGLLWWRSRAASPDRG